MLRLPQEKCVACRRDSPPITDAEIAELHPLIADWTLTEEEGIPKLLRVFRFVNFEKALSFTNAVGEAAEKDGHHPRIITEWGRVSITWWTHKIKNLHRNDFIMASKVDQIYVGTLYT